MKLSKLSAWIGRLTLIVVGIAVGMGIVVLVQLNAETVIDTAIIWGAAVGIGVFLLAVLLYSILRPKTLIDDDGEEEDLDPQTAQVAALAIAGKFGVPEEELLAALPFLKRQTLNLAQIVARIWSSATALGAAIAVTGSVIAMVTAVAALRQVDRIDFQNRLIQQQLEEAKASRAASVFAAQLPSLLAAMDDERGNQEGMWVPSSSLIARIQALIDLSEPFRNDSKIDVAVAALNEIE